MKYCHAFPTAKSNINQSPSHVLYETCLKTTLVIEVKNYNVVVKLTFIHRD